MCLSSQIQIQPQAGAPSAVAPISTDRPGFSDSATLVPAFHFQLESGITFNGNAGSSTLSIGDALLRYGFSNSIEIRVGGVAYGEGASSKQWLDPVFGFKVRIPSRNCQIAVIAQSSVPLWTGALTKGLGWLPSVILAASKSFGSQEFGCNLGIGQAVNGTTRFTQVSASAFMSHSLGKADSITFETWLLNPGPENLGTNVYAGVALTHLLSSKAQVDIRLASGFRPNNEGWVFQTGYSILF